jgi:large subunit ribosomal protein L10
MPRPEKVQAVAEIKERLESANAVFLAEYAGLSVQDQQTLRRSLKKGGAEFKVVKMTLARRAAADLDIDSLDDLLLGPTGLAFADGDAVLAAKALKEFAKEHEVFAVKGGLLGREFLGPERIDQLAEIESREVLLSKILRALQAPMANLAGLLAALPRGMATAMQQLIEKLPEEEPAADVAEGAAGAGAADSGPEEDSEAADGEAATEIVAGVDDSPDDAASEEDYGDTADAGEGPAAEADESDETEQDEPAEQAEEE